MQFNFLSDTYNSILNTFKLKEYLTKKNLPFFILGLIGFLNISIFWPGLMNPDSIMQYNEALAGIFGDHHPPIMAILWRFLHVIYPGSGLIFLAHMLLLYVSCAIFMHSSIDNQSTWLYAVYPILPPIFFYSSMIWKDVSFAFSYLLLGALISYFCMYRLKPTYATFGIMAILLFYGTAVKFQAQYVAPALLLGIWYIIDDFQFRLNTIILILISYLFLILGISQFNSFFVSKQNHAWKFVKIYDLAGMSLTLNKPLFPDYILKYKTFSMGAIKEKFNYERVDDIVFFDDSPIPRVETKQERDTLLHAWYTAVWNHPLTYVKHRYKNWSRILHAKPLEKLDSLDFKQLGLTKFSIFQRALENDSSWMYYLSILIFGLLRIIRYLLSFSIVLMFMLMYIILALLKRNEPEALPLLVMNGAALLLVLSLFPFCMASSLRYVYAAICWVHASHPLAYRLCKKLFKQKIQ